LAAGRVAAALLAALTVLTAVLILSSWTGPAVANTPAALAAPTTLASDPTATPASESGPSSPISSTTGQPTESSSAATSSSSSALSTSAPASASSSSAVVSTPISQTPESTVSSASDTPTSSSAPSVGATVVPATPPAAAQSEIGRETVLIAIGVLLIAVVVVGLVVAARNRRRSAAGQPAAVEPSAVPGGGRPAAVSPEPSTVAIPSDATAWSSRIDGSSLGELMTLMVDLGDTMVDSGDPVTHVRDTLVRVAEVNGVRGAEVIVLPTALIVTLPGMQDSRTEVASTGESKLRLDQVEAVFTVADAAERGQIGARAAVVDLRAARDLPPPFAPAVIVAGHAVIAMGLAVILAGGWTEIGVAAVLGAGVGVIKQWAASRRLAIQVFLPVTCAFLVAAAVALLARTELHPSVLPPILGALVTFIPGGLLTTAVIELATAQMISGASRFVYGSLQLVVLSLGIVGGLQLVGIPAITVSETGSSVIGAIAPWIGVLVFGVGVLLSYAGRPGSLGWMLLVLYVAYAGQVVGGLLFGSSLSAFVGAAAMTPVAVFVATQRTGPPTLVTFLPAFWLLVPGAIALVGVTQVMSEARVDGVSAILGAGVTIISIALGVVLGLSVGDWVKNVTRDGETASGLS
jgi:uncharacterized membrane protein YjjP (DUF1212 family)